MLARFSEPLSAPPALWRELGHYGVKAVLKPESFPIDKIYVPVKRRKELKPDVVQDIAQSILEIGQQVPIHVRADEDRFILVEGLHRLEACKALGEGAILGLLVSPEVVHPKTPYSESLDAERQKMERLRKLRLEREAAEQSGAVASRTTASRGVPGTETALLQRKHPEKTARNNSKASQSGPGPSAARPKTLSEWIKQKERDGRY